MVVEVVSSMPGYTSQLCPIHGLIVSLLHEIGEELASLERARSQCVWDDNAKRKVWWRRGLVPHCIGGMAII